MEMAELTVKKLPLYSGFGKYSDRLTVVTLQPYSKIDQINKTSSAIYTQYLIMTK
jgi:hypothetical protein